MAEKEAISQGKTVGLLEKGISLGALMAPIIGGTGAGIPEVTLLASVFRPRPVGTLVITILTVAILTGYVFQIFQAYLL